MTLQVLLVQIRALVPYFFFGEITILVHTFWGYSQLVSTLETYVVIDKKNQLTLKKNCHSV